MTAIKTRHRGGAPLLPPAIAYGALTVLAVVLPPLVAGVRPWSSDADLLTFFRDYAGAAHLNAFLTLGSAVPLAVFAAIVTDRLRCLGVQVPGRVIAQVGGTIAAAMLALAGAATLAATQDHVSDSAAAIRVLYSLTYATGGPAFVMFSGLLVAGVSISALAFRVLPRGLALAGIVLAVVCEVASLAVGFDAVSVLLPVCRFASIVWMITVAATLPAQRRQRNQAETVGQ